MSSKMLIDASHPEETRVVVLKGNRVEEFDFEAANRKQLRGNIYLAKVTRVEPSLQAAFVDYGGNRHGFLAFSEIHPDYYQIPHADRQALLEEEAAAHRDEDEDSRGGSSRRSRRNRRDGSERASGRRGPAEETISEPVDGSGSAGDIASAGNDQAVSFDSETGGALAVSDDVSVEDEFTTPAPDASSLPDEKAAEDQETSVVRSAAGEGAENLDDAAPAEAWVARPPTEYVHGLSAPEEDATTAAGGGVDGLIDAPESSDPDHARFVDEINPADENGNDEDEFVEQLGGDALEDTAQRAPRARRHHYKIQEVIKRRQILLVQVVKEERGNKGAALTTYMSLAGRYSVLMPNTARGGGISRKITDAEDRKRLKSIAQGLEVPEGMGIILRTAGASRSPVEVNRDFEYLLRMWESVRELTLKSTAPTLVYEEGSLIKRSIRDLYTRDVEDIVVSGEEGYREAREFIRMLMPGASKSVQLYSDPQPIFARAGAEAQLDAMFSNHVTLKSGGYLVINQTEALVAIDVNSGRSTREHNIEDTALRTNLEAADEIARQLRLRDLAGLIVVDFIDMEEGRNNRAVERRIKEALKNDRARIQIGRISHFGLLEMSRQRIRTGVLEGSTVVCPHCAGAGTIRSTASIALHVLRLLEDALIKDASHNLIVRTRTEVALYMLNQKRAKLTDLESRFGVSLTISVDASLTGMIYHAIERGEFATPTAVGAPQADLVRVDSIAPAYDDVEDEADEDAGEDLGSDTESGSSDRDAARADGTAEGGRRRKRRRRRRGRDRESLGEVAADGAQPPDDALATMARIEGDFPPVGDDEPLSEATSMSGEGSLVSAVGGADDQDVGAPESGMPGSDEPGVPEQPRRRRSRRGAKAEDEAAKRAVRTADDSVSAVSDEVAPAGEPAVAPKRRRSRAKAVPTQAAPETDGAIPELPLGGSAGARQRQDETARPAMIEGESTPSRSREPAPVSLPSLPAAADANEAPETAPREPDPSLPKRSGWWQRAKATFGS